MIKSDIIVGLQHGDEGKGKITYHLIKNGNYDTCVRFNGGPNAGHTIYINNEKYVTHQIPSGILYKINSLIGPCCILDITKLFKELSDIEKKIPNIAQYLKISENIHLINQKHINEDFNTDKVGSTKCGIRPCYRDKYNRSNIQLKNCSSSKRLLQQKGIEIVNSTNFLNFQSSNILFEGAQGFMLDIDWGDYPYVTSCNCIASYALLSGISPKTVQNIWGIAKIYDTYIGTKYFRGKNDLLDSLGDLGNEYGTTTGRRRITNWLNLPKLKEAILVNGITHLVLNKCDIIEQLDIYYVITDNEKKIQFNNMDVLQSYIKKYLKKCNLEKIMFSYSKDHL